MSLIKDIYDLSQVDKKAKEPNVLRYNKLYWAAGMGLIVFILTQEIKLTILAMQPHLWAWALEYGLYLGRNRIEIEQENKNTEG